MILEKVRFKLDIFGLQFRYGCLKVWFLLFGWDFELFVLLVQQKYFVFVFSCCFLCIFNQFTVNLFSYCFINSLFLPDMPSAYPLAGGFFFIIAPFFLRNLGFYHHGSWLCDLQLHQQMEWRNWSWNWNRSGNRRITNGR